MRLTLVVLGMAAVLAVVTGTSAGGRSWHRVWQGVGDEVTTPPSRQALPEDPRQRRPRPTPEPALSLGLLDDADLLPQDRSAAFGRIGADPGHGRFPISTA